MDGSKIKSADQLICAFVFPYAKIGFLMTQFNKIVKKQVKEIRFEVNQLYSILP